MAERVFALAESELTRRQRIVALAQGERPLALGRRESALPVSRVAIVELRMADDEHTMADAEPRALPRER